MKAFSRAGSAVIEWVLCVPVLAALAGLLFGFFFLVLRQVQLEDLCARTADRLGRSDAADTTALESEAALFLSSRAPFEFVLTLDRHAVAELAPSIPFERPPVEIIGVELKRPFSVGGLTLRAYARAARVR